MGWLPFQSPTREESIRSGSAIPNRAERQACWASRDIYFQCLDAHSIVDAAKDPSATAKACPAETAAFEKDCAKEWVKYFKQWRVADLAKKRRLEALRKEGAQEVGMEVSFTGAEAAEKGAKAGNGLGRA